MVSTMVVNFVKHLKMHLNILTSYYCQLIFDEMAMLILDLTIMNDYGDDDDDDDENLLIQDDWLLVVLVHVLQLFAVAILFDDFETMSKFFVQLKFRTKKREKRKKEFSYFHLCICHF